MRLGMPRLAVVALMWVAGMVCGQAEQTVDRHDVCGAESVLAMAWLSGAAVSEETQGALMQRARQGAVSMADQVQMARRAGLALEGVAAQPDELLGLGEACLVHLTHPNHFAVLLDGDSEWCRLIDRAGDPPALVATTAFRARFGGKALVRRRNGGPSARLRVERPYALFEADGLGQTVTASFSLTNAGALPLTLKVAGTTCSCTVAEMSAEPLKPGGSRSVEQVVYLRTNDPRAAVWPLSLYGHSNGVECDPASLSLRTVRGVPQSGVVTIRGPEGLAVRSVACANGVAEAVLGGVSTVRGQATAEIVVRSVEDLAPGLHRSALVVKLVASERELTIPVTVAVAGRLATSPRSVFYGFVRQGGTPVIEVTLTTRAASQPGKVLATCTDDRVLVTVVPPAAGQCAKVRAELRASRAGLVDAQLVLSADVDGQETVTLPVTALIEPGQ